MSTRVRVQLVNGKRIKVRLANAHRVKVRMGSVSTNARKLQGTDVSGTAPTAGQVLSLVSGDWTPTDQADLSTNAVSIQGKSVSTTAPTADQVLSLVNGDWTPTTVVPAGGRTVTSLATYLSNNAVFNVKDYGAIGDYDGTTGTDDTDAFQAAIAAAIAAGGGVIRVPAGWYKVTETLDLVTNATGICLYFLGDGPRNTRIYTTVTSTAGIIFASTNTRYVKLAGFSLHQTAKNLPTSQTAGNYGIRTDPTNPGVGFEANIEHVEIFYFANSAIFIEGLCGPTVIRDCAAQHNAGYGVEMQATTSSPVQDITIIGGGIANQWGGVRGAGVASFHMADCDIELNTDARLPALYLTAANGWSTTGSSIVDSSLSVGASTTITPSGVIVLDNAKGCVIVGGVNLGRGSAPNILIGTAAQNNTIIGGLYDNTSQYFADFSSSTQGLFTTFIQPFLTGYDSGKGIVHDSADNQSLCVGVTSNAGIDVNANGIVFRSTSKNVQFAMSSGNAAYYGGNASAAVSEMRLGANGGTILDNSGTVRYRLDGAGRFLASAYRRKSAELTDAATVTVSATTAGYLTLAAGGSRTIAAPTQPATDQELTFEILNNTAGAITTTWDSAYALASAWVDPAPSKRRTITFHYNDTLSKWVEICRSAGDI